MSHKFYKSASKQAGLPGRIANSGFEKLKKIAHDVWSVDDAEGEVVATRKREETAEINHELAPDKPTLVKYDPGEIVLFFLGGRKLEARVLADFDGVLTLSTDEGYVDIPASWCRKAQAQPAPNPSPRRRVTREDIPVMTPSRLQQYQQRQQGQPAQQPQMDPQLQTVANEIQRMVRQYGGSVALELSPSTYLVVRSSGQGVTDELFNITTQRVDQKSYQSIQELVQSRGLKTIPQARPASGFENPTPAPG